MNKKQITFTVNRSDVRNVARNASILVIDRFKTKYNEDVKNLGHSLDTKDGREIIKDIGKILLTCQTMISEFDGLVPLFQEIADAPEKDKNNLSSSPDTEVLENLPDLKENSLGVDRGSIEPITITPNHPKE